MIFHFWANKTRPGTCPELTLCLSGPALGTLSQGQSGQVQVQGRSWLDLSGLTKTKEEGR